MSWRLRMVQSQTRQAVNRGDILTLKFCQDTGTPRCAAIRQEKMAHPTGFEPVTPAFGVQSGTAGRVCFARRKLALRCMVSGLEEKGRYPINIASYRIYPNGLGT